MYLKGIDIFGEDALEMWSSFESDFQIGHEYSENNVQTELELISSNSLYIEIECVPNLGSLSGESTHLDSLVCSSLYSLFWAPLDSLVYASLWTLFWAPL